MQTRVLVFTSAFLLLGILESVLVPCPECGGIGYLGQASGMEGMRIVDVKNKVRINYESCGVLGYDIAANVSVVNEGPHEARGYIVVTSKDPATGKILHEDPTLIHIPPGAKRYVFVRQVFFGAIYHSEVGPGTEQVEVSAEIPSGPIVCPSCGGKEKIKIIELLLGALPPGAS